MYRAVWMLQFPCFIEAYQLGMQQQMVQLKVQFTTIIFFFRASELQNCSVGTIKGTSMLV